ncbi:phthiocerol/phthiodiolone dimycocerosyl transferase [Mycolicibacterium litorale]|uniref:Phthiocerol/phthiodiolone dimycocerosyl transferase n=1 Tax=Mycolicibacterium litorale TaxID=758802 RepID=A0A6S6P9T3_9MYCO|nr:acyltransferase [Mycolicibacterium litorale]BCI53460.1 phthiocerol/phthiodiolone dimycocerosyl transferase [Mycolicibacterium litorale]
MFSTSGIRKLAPSEEFFAETQTFTSVTVFLEGALDVDAMAMAFDVLLEVYPVYAGHLEQGTDGRYEIVTDDLLHGGMWMVDGDGERAPHMRLDQNVSLLNLLLRTSDGRAELTLFVHHSLADGHHIAGLFFELFSRYTELIATGDVGPIQVQQAPEPVETVLAQRGVQKLRRSGLDRFIPAMFAYELPPRRSSGSEQPTEPVEVPASRGRLTRDETTALVRFGRKNRLFVNSLVSAAILLAEWRLRQTPHIPIPYLCPVNLRGLLEPPVTPTGCTLALGVACYLAEITSDTTLTGLAHDIADTLQTDLSEGVIQQSMLHFSLQYEEIPGLPDAVIFTNIGNVSAVPTPPGLEVVDYRSEFHRASAAVVDVYTCGIAAGQLRVEHHVQNAASERSIESILSLLRAATLEYQH